MREATGSGTLRQYSFQDVLVLKVVKRLLDTGVSLQNIRTAIDHLREQGIEDLSSITLMSDGASIYECTSDQQVLDLLHGGQAVFGIALGVVVQEVEGSLAGLPVDIDATEDLVSGSDELSLRRASRSAG
jgi:DNA-binding transcriptional MerR regulator